ncbi:Coenzyme Q-binding protein COQ10 [Diplonema papillatum]|nr:Coenzyme Q-binding protein COQ10 [Diplonema papillatum]
MLRRLAAAAAAARRPALSTGARRASCKAGGSSVRRWTGPAEGGRAGAPSSPKAKVKVTASAKPSVPEGAICYCEHLILGWSPEQMYQVVSDVEKYTDFLPWCVDSTVRGVQVNGEGEMVQMDARICIGVSFFKQKYLSSVEFFPPHNRIRATLTGETEGELLEYLQCEWSFSAGPTPNSAEVDFEVIFKFRNSMHQQFTGTVLSQVVEPMVSFFASRSSRLYGEPSLHQVALPLRVPSRHNANSVDTGKPDFLKLLF